MNAKQTTALCSMLGLLLSGSAYADNGAVAETTEIAARTDSTMDGRSQGPMFERGSVIRDDQMMRSDKDGNLMVSAGINLPGRIKTDDSNDFFVTGSFIYWMASTDGLQFLDTEYYSPSTIYSGIVPGSTATEVFIKPKYKPGFKAGLGYSSDFDDWTAYLEYTWLHQKDHASWAANYPNLTPTNLFLLSASPYSIGSDLLYAKWRLEYDVLDFSLLRASYVGRRLIVEPFVGLRAAWIRQKLGVNLSSSSSTTPWAVDSTVFSTYRLAARCNSWSLGARAGLHSEWLLGAGVRLDAKASGSLLFTRYTKLLLDSTSSDSKYYSHYDTVKANAELGLGFGWGCYFGSNDNFHVDLVATYDFNIWWSQNFLAAMWDTLRWQTASDPTDLVFHGPTVALRLDF